jgi:CDP-glycerol glycerophosphotransferase (TagB/SpsB family)
MAPSSWNDTYDVYEYFKTTASAVRALDNIAVVIKLRSNRVDEPFYREAVHRAYDGIPHRIVIHEPIAQLLRESDIVVSCHSTVVIEALMSHRPVVLDASLPIYNKLVSVDFEPHRVAGALLVATNQADLTSTLTRLVTEADDRSQLVFRAGKFMNEEYLLHDGKSSVRLADTVRTLAGAK